MLAVLRIDDDNNVIFQQDGGPARYADIVTEFLDATFPRRWM